MTEITFALLRLALPRAQVANLEKFAPVIEPVCQEFGITTDLRKVHFLAQITHECGSFGTLEENLNYGADGLLKTFPTHFNAEEAKAYARRKEAIANRVYGGRYGNGPEGSGDGWRYHGRGPIQLTFKDNYAACGKALGLDLVGRPELLFEPEVGMRSAGWFWSTHKCTPAADADDVRAVTRRINGGVNGLTDRMERLAAFRQAFAAGKAAPVAAAVSATPAKPAVAEVAARATDDHSR